jgi:DNA invertase Pin-like site-specific DNA recombinase
MTSALAPQEHPAPTAITGRTYGYVRASYDRKVESPDAQAKIIATHCQRIGRRLDEVFFDDALSGGLPLAKREGDHVVVVRSHLMFRSFADLSRNLGEWAKLGVVVHLCDIPVGPFDPESTVYRIVLDFLALFSESRSRRTAARCRRVFGSLKAEGRRNTRFAPFGFKWEKRGRYSYLVPELNEQQLCVQAAEMYLKGYSLHQIRRYFAYEWKVRNRVGNQFDYTEIRNMALRGAELLQAAEPIEADSSVTRE